MLGCEIIEAATEGDIIVWSQRYTIAVLRKHGFTLSDYLEGAVSASEYPAHAILEWLGY